MNNVTALKWFHYDQNNSGGYFIIDDEVAEDVFIQAPSAAEAEERANALFDGCSEYCECCGPRWSTGYVSDKDGTDVPMRYGTPITEETASAYRNQARLHYYDGRIEAVKYKTKESPFVVGDIGVGKSKLIPRD